MATLTTDTEDSLRERHTRVCLDAGELRRREELGDQRGISSASPLPSQPGSESLRETMARFEAWVSLRALERHGQRRIATARSLGITRECLYK